MDAKTLKELIKSVAEIKERRPVVTSGTNRRPKEWVTEIDPVTGEEVEVERNIPLVNDTLGFEIVKIKPVERLCELGCGEMVCDQVVEKRLGDYPHKHWKTRCKNCQMYLTPDGEGFVKSTEINNYYLKWYNGKNMAVVNGQICEEIITNEGVIRKFL